MIQDVGRHVQCVLTTNIIVEGIVKKWTDNECILQSLDNDNILIIPHPNEDIILIKVILSKQHSIAEKIENKTELEQKFEEVYNGPSNDELRVKNLAELKVEIAKQDRNIIANKLKSHYLGQPKKAEYGYPGFFKKSSAK